MKIFPRLLVIMLAAITAVAQTGEIAPGDNLVVEGIPKIPASIAEAVSRYTEARAASLASWHPARREMLISTRFGDTPQIHHVKFPGGARTQLTFFPDRVTGASYQPTKGDYFLFRKDAGGNEVYQLYRYDLATGDVTRLTDGKSRHGPAVWSNAGDRVAFGSVAVNLKGVTRGITLDLHVMDPTDPKSDRVLMTLEGGGWSGFDWSPDDRRLAAVEGISVNESYLWLFDVATGQKTLLTPKGEADKVAYEGVKFSRDGKGIYTTTDRDAEFRRLAYIDLATREHIILTDHIKWDVDSFDLSPDGRTIAFVTNENGLSRLRLLDTATRREKPAPQLPAGLIFGVEWHKNGEDLGFTLGTVRSASDAYSYNIRTGKVERWTYSETGGLNTENLVEPELVRWKSFDDREITGFLYRPPAKFTGKRPVIINIHGGPEGQARPSFLGRNNYLLNEMGVALIYPNVRGSSGYGKTFLKLDDGILREGSYKDIGALLDWIKTRPDLDADRVMVTGGSYGGHMTWAVATLYSDRIRAALPVVGPSHLATFLKNTETYRRDLRRVEYGDERDPKVLEFMERTAPLNNADKIKVPLFVVQGKNDPRVPASESIQMVEKVRKNGIPVWFLMANDEGHGFAKKKNADFQFYATVLFVQQYLLK
jgi:dipeptidyl aminopeptidase/acylaminoacyl peptidase